jgi:hypothetical protein
MGSSPAKALRPDPGAFRRAGTFYLMIALSSLTWGVQFPICRGGGEHGDFQGEQVPFRAWHFFCWWLVVRKLQVSGSFLVACSHISYIVSGFMVNPDWGDHRPPHPSHELTSVSDPRSGSGRPSP